MNKTKSTEITLSILGILVAVAACISTIIYPEIREFLGLDKSVTPTTPTSTQPVEQAIVNVVSTPRNKSIPPITEPSTPPLTEKGSGTGGVPSKAIQFSNIDQVELAFALQSQGWVECVAFSPDGNILAWAGGGGFWLYDLRENRILLHLTGHTAQVHSISFTPDGSQIYTGGVDAAGGQIKAWDWRRKKVIWSVVAAPESWGVNLVNSSDGKWLASSGGHQLILWNVLNKGLQKYRTLSPNGDPPAFSPDGKWVAFWNINQGFQVFNLENEASILLPTPSSETPYAFHLAFAPDSSTLAAGLTDNTIKLWRISDGAELNILKGHTRPAMSVAFSPDGTLLASGSHDHTIKVWLISNGSLLKTFEGHGDTVTTVAFSPDGKILASGSNDGTIRLWEVKS